MERLPRFSEEQLLAATLKTPQALMAYEKIAVGLQIKKNRKKMRVTQQQLAKKLKTSQSVIARIEAGKQNITLDTLIKISIILGKRLHVKLA